MFTRETILKQIIQNVVGKYKYIIISTGVTALTVGGVIYYLLDNMSLDFGPSSNAGFH